MGFFDIAQIDGLITSLADKTDCCSNLETLFRIGNIICLTWDVPLRYASSTQFEISQQCSRKDGESEIISQQINVIGKYYPPPALVTLPLDDCVLIPNNLSVTIESLFNKQQQHDKRRSQSVLSGHSEIADHSSDIMVLQDEQKGSNDVCYMTHKGSSKNVRMNLNGNDSGISSISNNNHHHNNNNPAKKMKHVVATSCYLRVRELNNDGGKNHSPWSDPLMCEIQHELDR